MIFFISKNSFKTKIIIYKSLKHKIIWQREINKIKIQNKALENIIKKTKENKLF